MVKEYRVDKDKVVTVLKALDLRIPKPGRLLHWTAEQLDLNLQQTGLVAAAIPCHTWTHLDATLGPNLKYRTSTGASNLGAGPEKVEEAITQTALARNTVESILDWVREGAHKGVQRWFWIEQGAYSLLRSQAFMKDLGAPMVASYCRYRIKMGSTNRDYYPAQKDSALWTNLRQWTPRRCNHKERHEGTIGGRGEQPKTEGISTWALRRWTPEELMWEMLLSTQTKMQQAPLGIKLVPI